MKFWLKRPGTSDFVGPLEIEEIRKQLAEGNLDGDFETMQATGQSLGALKRATDWRPLADTCKPPTIHQQPEREHRLPRLTLPTLGETKVSSLGKQRCQEPNTPIASRNGS